MKQTNIIDSDTVEQRSPEIAPQNIENLSKMVYDEFARCIVSTFFSDFFKLNNFVKVNMFSFRAVFAFFC
jgi:hypothetical protein